MIELQQLISTQIKYLVDDDDFHDAVDVVVVVVVVCYGEWNQ